MTVASVLHPLSNIKSVPIHKILESDFVTPNIPLFGQLKSNLSLDGWRDDVFKRKIPYRTSSLKLVEEIVTSGKALAYLPDYVADSYIQNKKWKILRIDNCPFICRQKIKLITKFPIQTGWIKQLF